MSDRIYHHKIIISYDLHYNWINYRHFYYWLSYLDNCLSCLPWSHWLTWLSNIMVRFFIRYHSVITTISSLSVIADILTSKPGMMESLNMVTMALWGFMRLLKWLRSNHCNVQLMSLKISAFKITLLTLIMNQTSKFWFIWKLIGLKEHIKHKITWFFSPPHFDRHIWTFGQPAFFYYKYCNMYYIYWVRTIRFVIVPEAGGRRGRSVMVVLVIITVFVWAPAHWPSQA